MQQSDPPSVEFSNYSSVSGEMADMKCNYLFLPSKLRVIQTKTDM